MRKKYVPVNNMSIKCFLLMGSMFVIYVLDNTPVSTHIGFELYSYVVKPLLWLSIAFMVWLSPRSRFRSYLRQKENIILWGFIFAILYIIITILAGLFEGFGKSPYNHSFEGIFLNILVIGSMLIGREYARGFITNNLAKKEKYIVFIFVSLVLTILSFPINKFTAVENTEEIVKLAAQYVIPEFCHNLLATYLTFLGGWLPAFIYMSLTKAFEWLSPVLPDLKWITSAFIGILCPIFSLFAVQNMHMKEIGEIKKSKDNKDSTFSWILTCTLSIGIIWFAVGVFPIYPSVIATGSMEPVIKPGDMILVNKILKEQELEALKEGDIIQFKKDNMLISHRIIKVIENNNQIRYRTKGDNNSSPDTSFVKPEDIKGKIVYIVPKIGWPTLLMKKKDNVSPE